jgi:tetratricopeptide (TPR) repeat protein
MLAYREIGLLALRQGDLRRALPLLEQAVDICQDADLSFFSPVMAAALGEAYTLAGRIADAVSLLTQVMEQTIATEMMRLQELRRRQGLQALYRQALALAEELGMRPLQAHCHRGLGTLYATIGRRVEARAELSTAIKLYRTMEMTLWLPEAEAALAQLSP